MFYVTSLVTWGILCCLLPQATPLMQKRSHQPADGHRFEREHHRYLGHRGHRYLHGERGLFSGVGSLLNKAAGIAKDVGIKALKVGYKIALPALKGIEWVTVEATKVVGLERKFLKSIAQTVKSSWKKAKAIEFPGKNLIGLIFPNRIFSIADKVTNTVMHFATKTKNRIKAKLAYSLYTALKVVFSGMNNAINALGYHCIPFNDTTIEMNLGVVNTVKVSNGTACGLDTLEPQNNVTITSDEDDFVIVTMPWVLRNLSVHIKSVDVSGFLVDVQNQSVKTTVKEIPCQGSVHLQKGTFLRFMAIHIEVGEIQRIEVQLGGDMAGGIMDGVIKTVSQGLGGVVQNMLNAKLNETENHISDYLLENAARSLTQFEHRNSHTTNPM